MKRWMRMIVTAAAVAVLGGCSSEQLGQVAQTGALLGGKSETEAAQYGQAARSLSESVMPIDYETERAIGGGVAVKAFEQFGAYYNDPEMERYVTLVGKAVGRVSDRPDLPYAFAILDNPTPNAFAGPGGYIFVTIGTLKNCKDEAELAAVLAHEVGHVCKKHALKTLQRAKLFEGLAAGASVADPKNSQQYGTLVDALDDALFTKGLDQKFEYEADLVGTDYAAAAGYSPWGLRDFVFQLESLTQGASGGWFQTHPPMAERVQRLDTYLGQKYTDFRSLPRVADRFKRNVTDRLAAASK